MPSFKLVVEYVTRIEVLVLFPFCKIHKVILRCILLLNELIFKNQLKGISFSPEVYRGFLSRVLYQVNILCVAVQKEYFLNAVSFNLDLALKNLMCIFPCKSGREVISIAI